MVDALIVLIVSGGAASWQADAVAALPMDLARSTVVVARQVVERQPDDCAARLRLGLLEERLGNDRPSQEHLDRARQDCPSDAAVLFASGRRELARGCPSRAVDDLELAVLAAPADDAAAAILAAGRAALAQRYADFDRDLQRLMAAAPTNATPPSSRLQSLAIALERTPSDGEDDPEKMLRQAMLSRLTAEHTGVDPVEARQWVRQVLRRRPTWSAAWVLDGTLELTSETARTDSAERAFLEALAVAADDTSELAAAWSGLFFVYLADGRVLDAAQAARQYRHLVPADDTLDDLLQIQNSAK